MSADAAHTDTPAVTRFKVYTEGDALYAAMLDAIRKARHSVKLESYIFANDAVGRTFVATLGERARAGVQVLVHVDAAGSLFWSPHQLEQDLRHEGVHMRWFHRWSWRRLWQYNHRNHRKILVIDGKTGFLGGFNIHKENSRAVFGDQRWRDTHIEVHGSLAATLQVLFDALWRRQRRKMPVTSTSDGTLLITNHSRRGRRYLRNLLAARFSIARNRIYLTTPYFVPDYRTQRGLIRAAQRGVDVRLLVPRKSDVRIAQWAARAAYQSLLTAGVKIYEYLPRMLHAKTLVIDGTWSCVGTANIDYRSFFLNYELNLASDDLTLARTLEEDFLADLGESEEILTKRWIHRAWFLRLMELIGWAARRWL